MTAIMETKTVLRRYFSDGSTLDYETTTCRQCGKVYESPVKSLMRGFCHADCLDAYRACHTYVDLQPVVVMRAESVTSGCLVCGAKLTGRAHTKTCSPKCRKALSRRSL